MYNCVYTHTCTESFCFFYPTVLSVSIFLFLFFSPSFTSLPSSLSLPLVSSLSSSQPYSLHPLPTLPFSIALSFTLTLSLCLSLSPSLRLPLPVSLTLSLFVHLSLSPSLSSCVPLCVLLSISFSLCFSFFLPLFLLWVLVKEDPGMGLPPLAYSRSLHHG